MLGHKWERAQGVVVQAQTGPPSGHGVAAAMHPTHEYVIEVRMPSGDVIRGQVTERSFIAHQVGSTVPVEVNAKTNEIRIDPSARVDSVRGLVNMAHQMRDAAAAGAVGGIAGMAGMGAMTRFGGMNQGPMNQDPMNQGPMNQDPMNQGPMNQDPMNQDPMGGMNQGPAGGASMQVIGPGGQQVPVAMQPNEIRNLAQAMMSGDPAAKQAAMERIRQIKQQVQQQQAGLQPGMGQPGMGQPGGATGGPAPVEGFSGSSGPSTFDPIGTPRSPAGPGAASTGGPVPGQAGGTFGEPAGFGQPGSFGSAGGFGSTGSPDPFRPPAPSSFGSFDTGTGQGTQQEKLAKLQQLLDKGILTESEYQAQRQQVINGF